MKNKNKINTLTKNYFKVPLNLFNLGLNINSIALYVFIVSCAEEFNPSVSFLSKKLKVSRNTIYKYLNELKGSNIISIIIPADKGQIAVYELNNPMDWRKYEKTH